MPIHLYWGDDEAARNRAVEALIEQVTDPAWQSINLTRLDGTDPAQAAQALEEARTAPFGGGDRVVLLQRSPFCHQCPAELAERLEASLELVPEGCHLLLVSPNKPDARLRTTKALQKLVKGGQATEHSFSLPAVWDGAGQVELVARTARELGLALEPAAAEALAEAIGSDSARLASELEKLALYVGATATPGERPSGPAITAAAVAALVGSHATNALQVGDALLAGRPAEAIALVEALLTANEPALRIVATLTGQIRGWLWVSLLDRQGEQDVAAIAKAAGIGNPKRIYVMRKQIRGRSPGRFLALLGQLLEVEAALKRGSEAGDAFRDGFLLGGLGGESAPQGAWGSQ
ncbi:DNA polymerase III subunit delta [Vulcanococcus limneticus Candia 3F8]|uniref:DNA polymerase III subunit delta n=1 Tax=Vulcanococcus limneticus TaxID=2170428 RepID=UPI000B995906|nr:DNA polymerase III subunit delta [Vulcanococcus limneticus]MCP9792476.1 DNA polymerase III subunit delta [Vulcanococcus limneticus MW73D5]MCP9894157.1 DNA polymerase III subunit delta [Vulcanococcus limneticus Candia 3F8]MCP9897800.1 DNA polymerase III subunit delta [Vulcanococcus limneticus Candia 3B3]